MDNQKLAALSESSEAGTLITLYESASEATTLELGMSRAEIGGGQVFAMRNDPTGGHWSQAVGLGVGQPVSDGVIRDIIAFYRDAGVEAASIQIAPPLAPPDIEELQRTHQLVSGANMVKFARSAELFPKAETDLRVAVVQPDQYDDAATVYLDALEMPREGLGDLIASSLGHPDLRVLAALDGDQIVAVACMSVIGTTATFAGAGTAVGYRRRGAQSALLAARTAFALGHGVEWLFVHTAEPESPGANASYNNMIRSGFVPLYRRPALQWRRDGQDRLT